MSDKCDKNEKKIEDLEKSKNEHTNILGIISTKLDAMHTDIKKTKELQEYTNGKVAQNTGWRKTIVGALAVILFLFPTITGIFVYFMKDMRSDMENMVKLKFEQGKVNYSEIERYIDDNYVTQ